MPTTSLQQEEFFNTLTRALSILDRRIELLSDLESGVSVFNCEESSVIIGPLFLGTGLNQSVWIDLDNLVDGVYSIELKVNGVVVFSDIRVVNTNLIDSDMISIFTGQFTLTPADEMTVCVRSDQDISAVNVGVRLV